MLAIFSFSFCVMGVYDNHDMTMLDGAIMGFFITMASDGILSLTKYRLNDTP